MFYLGYRCILYRLTYTEQSFCGGERAQESVGYSFAFALIYLFLSDVLILTQRDAMTYSVTTDQLQ